MCVCVGGCCIIVITSSSCSCRMATLHSIVLFKEVQLRTDAEQLRPLTRTQYMRTAFQVSGWVWCVNRESVSTEGLHSCFLACSLESAMSVYGGGGLCNIISRMAALQHHLQMWGLSTTTCV